MFNIDQKNLKNANLFAAGLALGTVGLKVLTSKDAKKVYAGIVAQEINEARNEEIFEENK